MEEKQRRVAVSSREQKDGENSIVMNRTKTNMGMGNIVKREMGTTVQCTASANTVYFLSI